MNPQLSAIVTFRLVEKFIMSACSVFFLVKAQHYEKILRLLFCE